MLKYAFVVVLCSALAAAVHVDKCKEIFGPKDGSFGTAALEDVRVSDCNDTPCKLRKGSSATISFDFKPEKKYEKLTTNVFGGIGIIRVPFREVHGANACKDIVRKSDGHKGCPLEAGTEYTYTNTFPILKSYPAVAVQVQYGLNDGKDPVVCFALPSKISN
ncbi:unnamed protein product [Allacma fusca]|uniref:MD-2-related lipid-recognition domain-containing protein n=1 Tax=Allacma fusca TaxID=39272 RepID=A0A8J2LPT7_9HEXA|nr:unnamed protein product [Allacma fusca]